MVASRSDSILRRRNVMRLLLPTVTVAMGTAVIGLLAFGSPVSAYDGGILASAATFVLHGLIPYRDFWLLYGPLGGYVLAIPTAIFGPSVELIRLAGLAVAVIHALLAWGLLRRLGLRLSAMPLAIGASTVTLLIAGPAFSAWMLALTFVLGAFLAAAHPGRHALIGAGVLLGFAVLARQDVGAYGVVAMVIGYRSLWPVVGLVPLVTPVAAALVAVTPLSDLYRQLIWYPLVGPRVYRAVPDPTLVYPPPALLQHLMLVWVPRLAILTGIVASFRGMYQNRSALALLVFALLCQAQTLGRGDFFHYAEAVPPAVMLLGATLAWARVTDRVSDPLSAVIMIGVLVTGATYAGGMFSGPDTFGADLRQAASFVRTLTCPDETIFVGDGRNRYTFVNPLLLYFLADRPPGVHDTMYNPGVTNTDDSQREMVSDLERNRTRLLVLDESQSGTFESFNRSSVPGSTILDNYIDAHYAEVARIGPLAILQRRGIGTRPEAGAECSR